MGLRVGYRGYRKFEDQEAKEDMFSKEDESNKEDDACQWGLI